MAKKIISASILSSDFARLGEEVKKVIAAGIDYIHFDVMDHHFVPNLSFGSLVCKALRNAGIQVPIDVHLMVNHPEEFIESFANAGANLLTFHPETVNDLEKTLTKIHQAGMKTGLAFNPEKTVDIDRRILPEVDLILLMSVNPGFAGQSFVKGSLEKIAATRQWLDDNKGHALLGIDGGIKSSNIAATSQAGADFFVVGSGLFHAKDYAEEVTKLRTAI